jgi:hypothetical protein
VRILLVLLATALVAAMPPPAADSVARLQQHIDAGEVTVDFDPARGDLPAVLADRAAILDIVRETKPSLLN